VRTARARLFLTTVLAASFACASGRSSRRPDIDRSVITQDQLHEHRFSNAFEAVEALRGNWLQTHGTDSFTAPSQVWVYLDNTKLGGIESLRSIEVAPIVFIRHYDGLSATARWGLDHGAGVIFVSTHR
jgi:hypothetical protein